MEHNNQFILNQEPDFIKSLSYLMDNILTMLLGLFVNKMIEYGCTNISKLWLSYQKL